MAIENPDDVVGDENEEDFVVFMKIPEETKQPEVSIVSVWPGDEQEPAPVEKKIDAEGIGWKAMDCGIKPRVVRPGNGYFRWHGEEMIILFQAFQISQH